MQRKVIKNNSNAVLREYKYFDSDFHDKQKPTYKNNCARAVAIWDKNLSNRHARAYSLASFLIATTIRHQLSYNP